MVVSDIFKVFDSRIVFVIYFKTFFELRLVYEGELQFAPIYTMDYRVLKARPTKDGTVILICE